jgi:hypothetical protein
MKRAEILAKYPKLAPGMFVRSVDGTILGILLHQKEDHFIVEKGVFFPHDFRAEYDDITEVSEGEITLAHHQDELSPWREESFGGWSNQTTRGLGVPPNSEEFSTLENKKPEDPLKNVS